MATLGSICLLVFLKAAFIFSIPPGIFGFELTIDKLFQILNLVGFCLGLESSLHDYKHTCYSGKSYLAFQNIFSQFFAEVAA